jgi:tRNA(adenine34) deaminase
MFSEFDEYCMQQALIQAQQAAACNEVPVGAVLAQQDQIIASGYNQTISSNDPTAHAEIVTLRAAAQLLHNYRLINTTLYVTLEPCPMCAGALLHARIQRVVFAASDPKAGALGGATNLYAAHTWNHNIVQQNGLLAEPCSNLLREFFAKRRK